MADVEGGPAPLVIYKGANLAKATKLREADEPVFEYPLATTMETMAGALHKSEEPDARDLIRIPDAGKPQRRLVHSDSEHGRGNGRGSEHDAAADVRRRDSVPATRSGVLGKGIRGRRQDRAAGLRVDRQQDGRRQPGRCLPNVPARSIRQSPRRARPGLPATDRALRHGSMGGVAGRDQRAADQLHAAAGFLDAAGADQGRDVPRGDHAVSARRGDQLLAASTIRRSSRRRLRASTAPRPKRWRSYRAGFFERMDASDPAPVVDDPDPPTGAGEASPESDAEALRPHSGRSAGRD